MKNLNTLTAKQITTGLKEHQFSSRELIESFLVHTKTVDVHLNAWTTIDDEFCYRQANLIDEKIASSENHGSLIGVPIGIKDVFNTKDLPTQMGSPIWKNFTPGNDARVVHSLKMADSIIAGKTVTAEFAVHSPGPTTNPHNILHMPGTSSSGSAAAVAARMVPLSVGTQTAGSIIRPASYCGIFGFKPSFGLIPRTAVLKTTDTLDTIGCFARDLVDLSIIFETIRVKGRDYPIAESALNNLQRQSPKEKGIWRVAFVTGPKWHNSELYAQEQIRAFIQKLSTDSNLYIEELLLPVEFETAHKIHEIIYDKTLAYYFKNEFQEKTLVSDIIYDTISRGSQITLDKYLKALEYQTTLAKSLDNLFENFDVILTLSTGGEPLKGLLSEDRPDNCLIWTLCHAPSINLPVFRGPLGLPFGAQIVGRKYNDLLLLSFARYLQEKGFIPECPDPTSYLSSLSSNQDVTVATNSSRSVLNFPTI